MPVVGDPLFNTRDAAGYLGMAVQTLKNLRVKGEAPEAIKLGRSVRYRLSALEAWINEHAEGVDGVR